MKNFNVLAIIAIALLVSLFFVSCDKDSHLIDDGTTVDIPKNPVDPTDPSYTIEAKADGLLDKAYFNTTAKAFVSEVTTEANIVIKKDGSLVKDTTFSFSLRNAHSMELVDGLIFPNTSDIQIAVTTGEAKTTTSNPVGEYYLEETTKTLTAAVTTVDGNVTFDGALVNQGVKVFVETSKEKGEKQDMPRVDEVFFGVAKKEAKNISKDIITVNGHKVHKFDLEITYTDKRQSRKFASQNINVVLPKTTKAVGDTIILVNNLEVQTAEFTRTYVAYVLAEEIPTPEPECGAKFFVQDESKTQIVSVINGTATYKVYGLLKDNCDQVGISVEGTATASISTSASPLARYEQTNNSFSKVSYSNPAASVVANHKMANNATDNAEFSVTSPSTLVVNFGTNGSFTVNVPKFAVEITGVTSNPVGEVTVSGTKFTRTEYTVGARVINGSFVSSIVLASIRQIDVKKVATITGEKWANNQELNKNSETQYKSKEDLLNVFDDNTTSLKESISVLVNVSMGLSSDATIYTVADLAKLKSFSWGTVANGQGSNRTDGNFILKSAPRTQEFTNSIYKIVLSTNEESAFYGAKQHEMLTSSWTSRTYVGQSIDNGVAYNHNGVDGKLYTVTEKFSAKYYNETRSMSTTRKVFIADPVKKPEWNNKWGEVENVFVSKSIVMDGSNKTFNIVTLIKMKNGGFYYTVNNGSVKEKANSLVSASDLSSVESIAFVGNTESLCDVIVSGKYWAYTNLESKGGNDPFHLVPTEVEKLDGGWRIPSSWDFNQETGKVEVTSNGKTTVLDLGFTLVSK